MGFKSARDAAIKALNGAPGTKLQYEARAELPTKNQLAAGSVTNEDVVKMLQRASGTHYRSSPHHQAPAVEVHEFTRISISIGNHPAKDWYVKLYFLDDTTFFISVHQ